MLTAHHESRTASGHEVSAGGGARWRVEGRGRKAQRRHGNETVLMSMLPSACCHRSASYQVLLLQDHHPSQRLSLSCSCSTMRRTDAAGAIESFEERVGRRTRMQRWERGSSTDDEQARGTRMSASVSCSLRGNESRLDHELEAVSRQDAMFVACPSIWC